MVSHGYVQLVNEPTTDRATLIDHVYFSSKQVQVNVRDVYYSDHDAVYCSVPLYLLWNVFTCLICLHVFNVTAFHGKQSKAMNSAHSNAHTKAIPKQYQSNYWELENETLKTLWPTMGSTNDELPTLALISYCCHNPQ